MKNTTNAELVEKCFALMNEMVKVQEVMSDLRLENQRLQARIEQLENEKLNRG